MNLYQHAAVVATLVAAANAESYQTLMTMQSVHGALGSIAFLVLFPIGAIIIRLVTSPNAIRIHAALQILSYAVLIACAGLGIHIAIEGYQLPEHHPRIGMVLLAVLFFQAPTGFIHHWMFKKYNKRTIPSFWHIWIGRIAILLGMVNGGFGLKLAFAPHKYIIAYSVVAGVMGTAYLAAIIYGEIKRARSSSKSGVSSASASVERKDGGQQEMQ